MKLTLAEVKPKARPRFSKGRAYHNTQYASWLEQSAWILRAQTDGTLTGAPVTVDIELHRGGATITIDPIEHTTRPKNHKGDIDNLAGGILDAIQQAGIIHNDSQVQHLTVQFVDCDCHVV